MAHFTLTFSQIRVAQQLLGRRGSPKGVSSALHELDDSSVDDGEKWDNFNCVPISRFLPGILRLIARLKGVTYKILQDLPAG